MKTFFRTLCWLIACVTVGFAQVAVKYLPATGRISEPLTLKLASSATFLAEAGSTVDLSLATLSLPARYNIPALSGQAGKTLGTDGSILLWGTGGAGSVTSVGVVNANGISASGGPITSSGSFTFSLGDITPSSVTSAGGLSGTTLTSSALTSGRVPYVSTAGLLADAAALTFNSGTGALSATSFVGGGGSLTGIVTSITGTSGQVTASASTGAVTLSLPTAITGVNSIASAVSTNLTLTPTGGLTSNAGKLYVTSTQAANSSSYIPGNAALGIGGNINLSGSSGGDSYFKGGIHSQTSLTALDSGSNFSQYTNLGLGIAGGTQLIPSAIGGNAYGIYNAAAFAPNANNQNHFGLYISGTLNNSGLTGSKTTLLKLHDWAYAVAPTTDIAIDIDNITAGTTSYAIRTGLGAVLFGDAVTATGYTGASLASPAATDLTLTGNSGSSTVVLGSSNVTVGGVPLKASATTASISTITGALTVAGGLGVDANSNMKGVTVTSLTSSGAVSGTRFTSTVATGTSPLVIASTTLVPNLYVAQAALSDTTTTNANLTGDVTSVGNAATLAAGSASVLNSGTLPAGRLPALTGDVTSSSGSAATTLAAGSASVLNSGTLPAGRLPALSGDVTSSAGSATTTLANIPTATPMAGSLLATAISAPATPAAGKGSVYVDSTSKNIAVKDDAGTVKHGVQTKVAVSNSFATAISDAGVVTVAQPDFNNLTGSVAAAQMPALTGDITTSAGAVATTLATVNSNVGTFGDATHVAAITVNGKGLVTAASNVTISASGTGNVSTSGPALTADQLTVGNGTTIIKTLAAGTQYQVAAMGATTPGYVWPNRLVERITQTSHGFTAGQVLYNANGTWTKAKADALSTTYAVGVVESSVDANNFVIVYQGAITLSGLSTSTIYYLSDATAGSTTTTAPTTTTSYLVPVIKTGTATQGYVMITSPVSLATVTVPDGGTGAATFTAHGVMMGNTTGALSVSAAGTAGQAFISGGAGGDGGYAALDVSTSAITGQLRAASMPALTGDINTAGGALATTLATVNSNVGTFGSATAAPVVTLNGKGLVTAGSNVTITPAVGSITGLGSGVATLLGGASSGTGGPAGTTAPTFTTNETVSQSIAANTSADGIIITNPTAATAANQRYSPRIRWNAQGWKTDATAGSQAIDVIMDLRPSQGTAAPSATLEIAAQVNGGGYGTPFWTMDATTGLTTYNGKQQINAGIAVSGSAANDFSGGTGTFKTSSGANQLTGQVTVGTGVSTPSISTASGRSNTGNLTINGKTDGGIIVTTADSTGQTITIKGLAQTVGAGIAQIPDLAGSTDTVSLIGKAETITGVKTFSTAAALGSSTATTQTAGSANTTVSTTSYADRNSQLQYNAQTGTTYTLVLADGTPGSTTAGVSMSNTAANTLTVPTNASVAFPTGWTIPILNLNTGVTTIAAAGGVTINSPGGLLTIGTQYGTAVLNKTGTNTWQMYGVSLPAIVGQGRFTAQTAAKATVATYTVGAADGTFVVSANVLVTTSTTHSFTVTCAYTDEGNTARTLTFNFSNVAGTLATSIANAGGAVPYEGVPMHIRAKTATAITIATTGTFTTVTYNVEGIIQQVN